MKKLSLIASYWVAAELAATTTNPTSLVNAQNESVLEVGKFSAEKSGVRVPNGWKPLIFKNANRRTTYTLVQDGDQVVVKAESNASASGLFREIKIDLKKYPFVRWRWKVKNILNKSDIHRKEGDDYPARIYITFEDSENLDTVEKAKSEAMRLIYGKSPPSSAISYL